LYTLTVTVALSMGKLNRGICHLNSNFIFILTVTYRASVGLGVK